jgi:WXG100 family type VII secretion target
MAHDVIKLDYPKAEEMCKTFKASAQQIDATVKEMTSIANLLQEGALLGRGGAAYIEAIRSKLIPSLNKLKAKYEELDKDVAAAVKAMQDQDRASAQRMS